MFVKLPNSVKIPVAHIGDVNLTNDLMLHNVLHVPYFTFNLIYASQLTKTSYCFLVVLPLYCVIQELQTLKRIGIAKDEGGLYQFKSKEQSVLTSNISKSKTCFAYMVNKAASYSLWHCRLGHSSSQRMRILH